MLFNSIDFAIFFPIVFVLYWLIAKHIKIRNLFLLAASYVFYGWWDWRFLSLIVFSSAVDYIVGQQLTKQERPFTRKLLLATSLTVNLGLLFYFKYTNFFITSFVDAFSLFGKQLSVAPLNIVLPVGISFYTFQTLSYSIDIYKRKFQPTNDVTAFFAFVAFFPQLVAGPIERASHLLPQFSKVYKFDRSLVRSGLQLMLWGFFKKMVIADRLAILVNEVFNNTAAHSGTDYTIATLFFTFQIYCDFSGYSDIAIGLARTMGFDLMKNFDSPYFSKSITEFWRRWHVSLSLWFRDYLYIPLGGSKKGRYRTYVNLFIVFLVSGSWHGASLNFVIWGAIHGFIIVLEKMTMKLRQTILSRLFINQNHFLGRLVTGTTTFFIVVIAWIFFRANTFADASLALVNIFSFTPGNNYNELGLSSTNFKLSVVLILFLVLAEFINKHVSLRSLLNKQIKPIRWLIYIITTLFIILYGVYGEDSPEFIYFQF